MSNTIKTESFEYRTIGKMRFIGMDAWRTGDDWGGLWERSSDFLPQLEALKTEFAADIPEASSKISRLSPDLELMILSILP